MYMRYYDSYPAQAGRMQPQKEPEPPSGEEVISAQTAKPTLPDIAQISENSIEPCSKNSNEPVQIASKKGILSSIQLDDIILIALLIMLLSESDDIIMPLIIGYILLGDKLPI